nr:1-(5-phosphoribosyl)-5-((5-phosphoribosylamino)methylideneamino)imidazole-4-carboxamide isomerase [Agitococcus sp.]
TIQAYVDAGVSWVIIGTKAVKDPQFVIDACKQFPNKIIVGIDAKDGWVATDGWAEVSQVKAEDLAKQFAEAGVSAIVYTDIARDGMMQGVNVPATAALARACGLPVIASGGVTNLDDITRLKTVLNDGVIGAITGRAIYEGTLNLAEAQQLADAL